MDKDWTPQPSRFGAATEMDKGSQMDKDWTPQPFTIWSRSEMDKDWTPPTHDLERPQMDKDWTPQPSRFAILVRLRTAPNREGLGGPILGSILVHLEAAPNREGLGGATLVHLGTDRSTA